jgi:AraC-like DNA-binding protein
VDGVELIEVSRSHERWSGTASGWDVCAVVDGAGAWHYRRSVYESSRGSVRMKEPGEEFSTPRVHQAMGLKIVRLDRDLVARKLEPLTPKPHLRLAQRDDPRLFEVTCGVFRRLSRPETSRLEADMAVHSLVTEVLALTLESPLGELTRPASRSVRWLRDYIEAHYEEEISLRALAEAAGLHEVYAVRAFREAYGVPPHDYQLRRRVLTARRRLSDGVPAAEVSLQVGFYDQSHLSRHFKRVLGITPGRYQRGWQTLRAR